MEMREEERTREKGQIRHRRGETPCVNNALVATLVVEINATSAI